MKHKASLMIATYVLGVVINFGHAWHECPGCKPSPQGDERTAAAVVISMTWPVYWPLRVSVELWRPR